jgi:membrane-associated phospholipid phosphatase
MPELYASDAFQLVQATLASPWLDFPMALLSTACEGWSLALIGVALVWAMERRLASTVRSAFPVLVSLLGAGLVVQVVKRLVHTPRPLSVLGAEHVHLVLEPLGQLSFPSGHAAAAAALAVAVALRYGRQVSWIWVLAFLGGLSRVYVGAHWVTDVGAGWLLGAACALVSVHLLRGRTPPFPTARLASSSRTTPEAA